MSSGAFIVEGRRAIEHIARCNPSCIQELLIQTGSSPLPSIKAPVRQFSPLQMQRICTAQTPQGMAAVVSMPVGTYSSDLPTTVGARILLLEHVQDPGNVGTLIRTAAALGFDGVILSGLCADPFSPKVVAASVGSVLSLWIRKTSSYVEIVQILRQKGWRLIATVPGKGMLLEELPPQAPVRLILALGNEGAGLSPLLVNTADTTVHISIDSRRVQSLNVAACGAICMYELNKSSPHPKKNQSGFIEL